MRAVAHTPRNGSTQWHDLSTHLHDTARLASHFAAKFQAGELAYIAGLVHDIGKYNPAFQRYLHDAHAGREATSVPHAVYGGLAARACYELGQKSHRNADFTVSLVPSRSLFPAFLSRF
jgi:CRISPR-associated endonuclease Cas3-HD